MSNICGKDCGPPIHAAISVFSACCWRRLSCRDRCSAGLFTRLIINVICNLFTLQRLTLNLNSTFRGALKVSALLNAQRVVWRQVIVLKGLEPASHVIMMKKKRIMTGKMTKIVTVFHNNQKTSTHCKRANLFSLAMRVVKFDFYFKYLLHIFPECCLSIDKGVNRFLYLLIKKLPHDFKMKI